MHWIAEKILFSAQLLAHFWDLAPPVLNKGILFIKKTREIRLSFFGEASKNSDALSFFAEASKISDAFNFMALSFLGGRVFLALFFFLNVQKISLGYWTDL